MTRLTNVLQQSRTARTNNFYKFTNYKPNHAHNEIRQIPMLADKIKVQTDKSLGKAQCIPEMYKMFNCWNRTEYAPGSCVQEVATFEECVIETQVAEFFEDYDPLRSGSISKSQFRRGLAVLGLSKLGLHDLQDGQFCLLTDLYQNPQKDDQAMWTKFCLDVESVFTQRNLEKVPDVLVPPQDIYRVPKPGTVDWSNASDDHRDLFEQTMERLRQRTNQRRVLAKPVFQDFDNHNNGHVTKSQFRGCLTMLSLHCTEPEMVALEAKFCNDVGFNYIAFLNELQPNEPPAFMYEKRLETLRLTNQRHTLPELNAQTDLEGVMLKVKTKVSRERIRVA